MLLLRSTEASSGQCHIIAIFGLGLIGSAVVDAMVFSSASARESLEFSWGDHDLQQREIESIGARVTEQIEGARRQGKAESARVSIVWCAGKGGFFTAEEELMAEFDSFQNVLNLCSILSARLELSSLEFHLVSSAGGLFEGKSLVNHQTQPEPMRAYGRLKLLQERALADAAVQLRYKIYRPSSVYGYAAQGRMGLVPTILMNGIKHKETRIFGNHSTLRDFVWNRDIGRFIARNVMQGADSDEPAVYCLVSGKPASIFEIQQIAESIIRRKVYFVFTPVKMNTADITYSSQMFPAQWQPTDIDTGIRSLFQELLQLR